MMVTYGQKKRVEAKENAKDALVQKKWNGGKEEALSEAENGGRKV